MPTVQYLPDSGSPVNPEPQDTPRFRIGHCTELTRTLTTAELYRESVDGPNASECPSPTLLRRAKPSPTAASSRPTVLIKSSRANGIMRVGAADKGACRVGGIAVTNEKGRL
ncbi:hypothetical protein BD779DRAFT_1477247 [Infundibulicybe gibba]|nr:hypothetical protein BD779DRAFT_1477247 [Infundibulicybe gibba]